MTTELGLAAIALAIWVTLLLGRGGFWLGREHEGHDPPPRVGIGAGREDWPSVVAVVPARNEADMLPRSLASLLVQDYRGPLSIVIVDDQSEDGTADAARRIAEDGRREVTVLGGGPPPEGWTGKVWAQAQGIAYASRLPDLPRYLLLTDADIVYAPESLTRVVARARANGLVLTSLIAKLNCVSLAERALIPAFVFFFQMLYPFAWVNARTPRVAAAAGGCMLVERRALETAGGITAIRGALIDDCALARVMKAQGPIWLGLTDRVISLRAYPHMNDIRRMVARSAYAQLRYSPLLLAGTIAGMAVTYVAAPALAFAGGFPANLIAGAAWALMSTAFQPTLRQYRLSPIWRAALPAIAGAYVMFTIDSACQHWRGRGGLWKGRVQAIPASR
ncbi:MAG TPA: glycosyltransferase [Hyphomicrobiaceae bacterium]|nr:glycosyltransferase [Hyphomicrobiaceae bacterium]